MTNHTPEAVRFAAAFANEVFAEMARKRETANELAKVLGVTAHTAGNRLNERVPFNAIEMHLVAAWLGIDLVVLVKRA